MTIPMFFDAFWGLFPKASKAPSATGSGHQDGQVTLISHGWEDIDRDALQQGPIGLGTLHRICQGVA